MFVNTLVEANDSVFLKLCLFPTSSFSSVFGWGMEQLKDSNVSTKSMYDVLFCAIGFTRDVY